ncbi:hypothetical protein [Phage Phass-1]|uniref:Uncharacterized protein n=1 Tax=Phage Phass-1 TaxID=3043662 RepID=A0AAF0LWG1_9CAUD|nr:hypothetical protein [Phage Phass-1]
MPNLRLVGLSTLTKAKTLCKMNNKDNQSLLTMMNDYVLTMN